MCWKREKPGNGLGLALPDSDVPQKCGAGKMTGSFYLKRSLPETQEVREKLNASKTRGTSVAQKCHLQLC